MPASDLQLHREDSVGRIELQGPDDLPRLELPLLDSLEEVLDGLAGDASCDGIVLHGSEKCFAAGADLSHIAELSGVAAFDFARRGQELFGRIFRFPKPVVAAVSGYCMGGAWDLAMSCHARLCTPETIFRHPGPTVGIFSGWGGTQRIPRLVGRARGNALLFEGGTLSAETALDAGVVERVCPWPRLATDAGELAKRLAVRRG